MRYCARCVTPDTMPDVTLDANGVCPACRNYERRAAVDWEARAKELSAILERYRSRDHSRWDCVVPVSGGKDSMYQVATMLSLGLNPLCVTAVTCDPSELGKRNLGHLRELGVDCLDLTSNRAARRKFNRIALREVGDISWPEHAGIFTIPVRIAVNFGIPLIIWGENSQNEYGGPAAASDNHTLSRAWLERFGGLLGMQPIDFVGREGIGEKDILPFLYPSDEELNRVGVTGLFLGYYLPWDGFANALIAQSHGFETFPGYVEGTCADYENLDNHQTGIHDYFRYLKFGFGRAGSLASLHARRGRLTREQAADIVRRLDGAFPWTCLGKRLEDILAPLEMGVDEFIAICDRFTNRAIFQTDADGSIVKDATGRPVLRVFPSDPK